MNDENDPAIIARCNCGCGGIVYVNGMFPLGKKDQGEIGKLVADGYSVERTTVGWVRSNLAGNWRCVSKRKATA